MTLSTRQDFDVGDREGDGVNEWGGIPGPMTREGLAVALRQTGIEFDRLGDRVRAIFGRMAATGGIDAGAGDGDPA